MSEVLIQSLQITALGMGLVFAAIIVLWLMMVILTALTADKKAVTKSIPEAAPRFDSVDAPLSENGRAGDIAKAAVVAVTFALADQETSSAHVLPEPPTAIVSAWQLGMRTRLLAEKGHTRRR